MEVISEVFEAGGGEALLGVSCKLPRGLESNRGSPMDQALIDMDFEQLGDSILAVLVIVAALNLVC